MAKSKEELEALKNEIETVNEKLQELTPEEMAQITGGKFNVVNVNNESICHPR